MYGEIKSKLQVRHFAFQQAALLMPREQVKSITDCIESAKVIENYIIGTAELPEYIPADDWVDRLATVCRNIQSKPSDDTKLEGADTKATK